MSTQTLLRAIVICYWVILGMLVLAPSQPYVAAKHLLPRPWEVVVFLSFGPAFWLNTRNIAVQKLHWKPIVLLAVQAVAAYAIDMKLIHVVATQVPFVLPARAALIWIVLEYIPITAWIYWVVTTGGSGVHYVNSPILPQPLNLLLSYLSLYAFHLFSYFQGRLAVAEARGRREAERLNTELLATQDLLAQTSRLAERAYVARELHDMLGHHLVALKVNLELAQHLVTESAAKPPLADSLALTNDLLADVRNVVSKVRSQPKMELGQAVNTLLKNITEVSVELSLPQDVHVSDPSHVHVLFRCVQEAITNTLKHARARHLWIEFSSDHHAINLVIRDDGKGVATLVPGHGLNGMRERLASVGGSLAINPASGQGFILTACIPRLVGLQA
ncbi:sensor histidine kinase [Crenothrix polyspora]|uniref:Putative Two-component system sensor protein n=1 Tax=Crenothrix polyspora TaxID=360316 RepID=A0A1R4H1N9_9GAMM|nr:sensor histidine kinase [Crenothrix polyspora]SJM90106.1 putative Two-component system sensor protein [Crenothrix polyspora]